MMKSLWDICLNKKTALGNEGRSPRLNLIFPYGMVAEVGAQVWLGESSDQNNTAREKLAFTAWPEHHWPMRFLRHNVRKMKMSPRKVRLFVKPFCGWCDEAQAWLDEHGIQYDTLDVTADARARQEMFDLSQQTL